MRTALFIALAAGSLAAFAAPQTHLFESDTKVVPLVREGKNLTGDTNFPPVTLESTITEFTEAEQTVRTPVWGCESVESDGTKGDWKGFWSAKKDLKPGKLKQAIAGLKFTDAVRLVKDGAFDSKPRSWAEFKSRIDAYDAKYGTVLHYRVLVQHGTENFEHLGYGHDDCQVSYVDTVTKVRTKVGDSKRAIQAVVRVHNGVLMPKEKETFTVTFDGFHHQLTFESSYNTYEVHETGNEITGVVYDLVGKRNTIDPSNSLELNLSRDGKQLHVTVRDTAFDQEADSVGSRKVVGTVLFRRKAWDPHSDTVLGNFERALDNNNPDTVINDLGVEVPDSTFWKPGYLVVTYKLRFENNPNFSAKDSAERTAELK